MLSSQIDTFAWSADESAYQVRSNLKGISNMLLSWRGLDKSARKKKAKHEEILQA
jgi:hypothetical protein